MTLCHKAFNWIYWASVSQVQHGFARRGNGTVRKLTRPRRSLLPSFASHDSIA
jgi:hypothetical protein